MAESNAEKEPIDGIVDNDDEWLVDELSPADDDGFDKPSDDSGREDVAFNADDNSEQTDTASDYVEEQEAHETDYEESESYDGELIGDAMSSFETLVARMLSALSDKDPQHNEEQGVTIESILNSWGKLEDAQVIGTLLKEVSGALAELHNSDKVHGNLTPSSILLTLDDAKLQIRILAPESGEDKFDHNYASPQRADGWGSSISSDVYSLGVIAYRMATGNLPSKLREDDGTFKQLAAGLDAVELLQQSIEEALEPDPDWRMESAEEFQTAMHEWLEAAHKLKLMKIDLTDPSRAKVSEIGILIPRQQESTGSHSKAEMPEPEPAKRLSPLVKATQEIQATVRNLTVRSPAQDSVTSSVSTDIEEDPTALVGKVLFGTHAVVRRIGTGPASIIYLARHCQTHTLSLIKSVNKIPEVEAAFGEDVRKQGKLKHSNIIKLIGYIESAGGTPYMLEEHIDGITLDELLSSCNHIDKEEEFVSLFMPVCNALVYAHETGTIHGNIKPTNVLLVEDGGEVGIKLLDFGSARPAALLKVMGNDTQKSVFEYLSPEQILSSKADQRSDVFSLMVLMYKSLTGQNPYPGETIDERRQAFEAPEAQPRTLAELRTDLLCVDELSHLLETGLAKNPDQRLVSVLDVQKGIREWIANVRLKSGKSKKDHKSSRNQMRATAHNLIALKQHQFDQESTVLMQLSSKLAAGPRRSPMETALRTVALVLVISVTSIGGTIFVINNFDWLKDSFVNVSALLAGKAPVANMPLSEGDQLSITANPTVAPPSAKKAVTSMPNAAPPVVQNSLEVRRNVFQYEAYPDYSKWIENRHFSQKRRLDDSQ